MKTTKFLSFAAIFLTFAVVVACHPAAAFPLKEELPIIELPDYEIIPLPAYTMIQGYEGLAETQSSTSTDLSARTLAEEQRVQTPITAAGEVMKPAEQKPEISPDAESVVVSTVGPEEEAQEELSGALEPAEEEQLEVIAREPEAAAPATAPSMTQQTVSPSAGLAETPETPATATTGKMSTSDILLILAVAAVVIVVVLASVSRKKKA